ncbi:unnamed protein product [Moneuplotes crassus]|uniref:Lysosomal Pro-X carboxypeptidase n=1 Tax=Euplotes crassus TaxID=5936 RepID=A0AAD1X8R5_EUPCR|nr:unnamed protein product [Moneuplotes crassus]
MKYIILALCLLSVVLARTRVTSPFAHPKIDVEKIKALHTDIVEDTVDMKIDHFNANGQSDTYPMRYLVNAKHYQKGGPIFFYAGNEGNVYTFYNNTGFMVNTLAEEYKALVVFAEHRYFGESLPFGDKSFETENLKYLNVEQTMTDYVEFIRGFRKESGLDQTPVIVFGGSYGGMLASWLRMKFPETFQGAIASSAPIIYFKDAVPEDGFYNVIQDVFTHNHPECSENIKKVAELIVSFKNQPEKIRYLQSMYNTCQAIETADDVDKITGFLYNAWIYMAMTNYPYPTEFLAPMPGNPVDVSCEPFDLTASKPKITSLLKKDSLFSDDELVLLQAAADSVQVFYNYTGELACNDLSGSETPNLDAFGWDILACNEMAMPMGTDGKDNMFLPESFSYEAHTKQCEERFGITPQFDFALTFFGGRNPTFDFATTSNIVFANGNIDPWNAGSITIPVSKDTVTINIENSAHHLELRDPNPLDPQSVVDARNVEREQITKWLAQFREIVESS